MCVIVSCRLPSAPIFPIFSYIFRASYFSYILIPNPVFFHQIPIFFKLLQIIMKYQGALGSLHTMTCALCRARTHTRHSGEGIEWLRVVMKYQCSWPRGPPKKYCNVTRCHMIRLIALYCHLKSGNCCCNWLQEI